MKRVLLIGTCSTASLEKSYERALRTLGCEVRVFDIFEALARNARFGRLGRVFSNYVAVEAWVQKANREMLVEAIEFQPDLVAVIGGQPVRVGALSQMKIACPGASLALVWPDTMLNFTGTLKACLPILDVAATYSSESVSTLKALGASHPFWLPLGADEELHGTTTRESAADRHYEVDVAFIGGWRTEREAALSRLTGFNLKIWGPEWDRRCKGNSFIMQAWAGKPLLGRDYAEAIRSSKVNLNIIDPTNYPAANMRFFEIPIAGGLQLSSACPEMDSELREGKHIFYYKDLDELPGLVGALLNDDERRFRVADAGRAVVAGNHTYVHRAEALLRECDGLKYPTPPDTGTSSAPQSP